MISRFDLDELKQSDRGCYQIIALTTGKASGLVDVDPTELNISPEWKFRLAKQAQQQDAARHRAAQEETMYRPSYTSPEPEATPERQIDLDAEMKRDLDEAAAKG